MQRLLPPFLVLILIAAALAVGLAVPLLGPPGWPWRLIGIVPLIAGVALNLSGAGLFARIGTNIKTFNEPGTLVVTGPFRFTRNPMYLGFTLMLVGVAALIGPLTAWIAPVGFFIAANTWYIPFEERRMQAQFGDDYTEYRRRVPRWISLTGSGA